MKDVENITSLAQDIYEGVELQKLILYTMFVLDENHIVPSMENIIVASFKLFPKSFEMEGFPQYPDGMRISKTVKYLHENYFLTGKKRHGYSMTDKARGAEKDIKALVKTYGIKNSMHMRRTEAMLNTMKKSPAYAKFMNEKPDTITESELCHILQGVSSTPRSQLRETMNILRDAAKDYKEALLLELLDYLENKFNNYLNGK